MVRFLVRCPRCRNPLPPVHCSTADARVGCPACGALVRQHLFPALYRCELAPVAAATAQAEDASCFYHPGKKAHRICDDCGRFLCALCELPFGETMLCASCLARRRLDASIAMLPARRIRFDQLALVLTFVPLLWFPLTLVSAPGVIFIVLSRWRKRPVFTPGWHRNMVVSLGFSAMQIFGWVVLALLLVVGLNEGYG